MTIAYRIRNNKLYKSKMPIKLADLISCIEKETKEKIQPSLLRNTLLNGKNDSKKYFTTYVRGIYLPFIANNEESVVKHYNKVNNIHRIGNYKASEMMVTNQMFVKGSYIVFAPFKEIPYQEKLITKNNYYFIDNISEIEQKKLLKLIELKLLIDHEEKIKWDKEVDEIIN